MPNRSRVHPVSAVAAVLMAGCQATTLPRPECAGPRRPAADFGAPSSLPPTASVSIEIKGRYVAARIRQSFETPLPTEVTDSELAIPEGQPGYIAQSGVLVKAVALEQEQVGTERLNLLTIRIAPWILHQERDAQSPDRWRLSKTEVQRYFALRLRLRPRLVTPATVPDRARRQALLQCGTDPSCSGSGVIVPLELHELYDVSNGERVACIPSPDERNPSYDMVTQKLHQGVLDALYGDEDSEGAAPLVLPGQKIVDVVGGIAGGAVELIGVALGTDGDLKIGFLLDQGTPLPFDAATSLTRYPQADWGVLIDPSFITAAITRKVTTAAAAAAGNVATVTVTGVTVSYERPTLGENLIRVDVGASASRSNCTVLLSIEVKISPAVRRNANGRSALVTPTSQSLTPQVNACAVFQLLLLEAEKLLFGRAEATVCSPGPCPAPSPPDPCPQMAEVEFEAGTGDRFYAIDLDTDGVFYITGRSAFLDRVLASEGLPARPPVPPCS